MIPIPSSHLARSLRLESRELISLVGGGGKSTLLFQIARSAPGSTIATTTTKMGERQSGGFPIIEGPDFFGLQERSRNEPVFVRQSVKNGKSLGVSSDQCDHWFADKSLCDYMVVEADGARHRPFKAPANFEPVVPSSTSVLLSVIGADALGRVIADQCHRPLRVAAIAGCSPYQRLTPPRAAAVLISPSGPFKNTPQNARRIVVVTKVPSERDDRTTSRLVSELCDELAGDLEIILVEHERLG